MHFQCLGVYYAYYLNLSIKMNKVVSLCSNLIIYIGGEQGLFGVTELISVQKSPNRNKLCMKGLKKFNCVCYFKQTHFITLGGNESFI